MIDTDEEILERHQEVIESNIKAALAKYPNQSDQFKEWFIKKYKFSFIRGFRKSKNDKQFEVGRNVLRSNI